MSEPAAATALPAQPGPTATDDLLMQAIGELKVCQALLERDLEARGPLGELVLSAARLADFQGQLMKVAIARSIREEEAARQPVPEPPARQRRSRRPAGQHRAGNPLKAVRSVLPAGLIAAFAPLRHALRHQVATVAGHVVTAQHVAYGTAAAVGSGVLVAGAVTLAVPAAHPSPSSAASSLNPPASIVAAVPVGITPSSGLPRRPSRAGADAATTLPLGALTPPSYAGGVPGSGPPSPDPSQPQQQDQQQAPQVSLVVSNSLDLGTGQSGTIRLAAFGGTVSWTASSSVAGLGLDTSSGTLAAGDSATVTVSLTADLQALAGPAQVTITYGDGKTAVVPVSWTVVPLPLPTVVPTDVLPTDLPVITGT